MKLFKLFVFSLVALPSVAFGMESAKPSFDEAAFDALLKEKGDKNVILCDAQVEYLRKKKSLINGFKSNQITGLSLSLKDGSTIPSVFCDSKSKCVSIDLDNERIVPCADHCVTCDGKSYNMYSVVDSLRKEIREYIEAGVLKKDALSYILERGQRLFSFNAQYNSDRKIIRLAAYFKAKDARVKKMDEYLIYDTSTLSMPWYRRPTVWAAAAVVGLGYYYRSSIMYSVRNPFSLWAGIKSLFSR